MMSSASCMLVLLTNESIYQIWRNDFHGSGCCSFNLTPNSRLVTTTGGSITLALAGSILAVALVLFAVELQVFENVVCAVIKSDGYSRGHFCFLCFCRLWNVVC